jgi:hypothetical protein
MVARLREDAVKLSTSLPGPIGPADNRVMIQHGPGDAIGRFLTVADAAEVLAVDVESAIRVGERGPWRIERTQLEVWIDDQYEATRRYSAWHQGEFANVIELSGARAGGLRPVD